MIYIQHSLHKLDLTPYLPPCLMSSSVHNTKEPSPPCMDFLMEKGSNFSFMNSPPSQPEKCDYLVLSHRFNSQDWAARYIENYKIPPIFWKRHQDKLYIHTFGLENIECMRKKIAEKIDNRVWTPQSDLIFQFLWITVFLFACNISFMYSCFIF